MEFVPSIVETMLSLSARTKKHILSKAKLDPLTCILESRAIVKESCNLNYSSNHNSEKKEGGGEEEYDDHVLR